MCKFRRGRCQIIRSVLKAAEAGAKKTCIMKKVRLNNAQANSYLATLEKHNFLSRVELSTNRSVIWKTTETGREIVKACEKCHLLLSDVLQN